MAGKMDEMLKMMSEEKKKDMGDDKAMAKKKVLQQLRKMASDLMSEDMMGEGEDMQKVTVAAPDKESLAEGLETAEEVVEEGPEALMEKAAMDEGDEYGDYYEEEDESEMTPEEVEAEIGRLMEMKRKMRGE